VLGIGGWSRKPMEMASPFHILITNGRDLMKALGKIHQVLLCLLGSAQLISFLTHSNQNSIKLPTSIISCPLCLHRSNCPNPNHLSQFTQLSKPINLAITSCSINKIKPVQW